MTLLEAMAHQEGFYLPNSRPRRNRNPLDLIWCAESQAFGAAQGDRPAPGGFKGSSGMSVFPDLPTGWHAAARWLSIPAHFDPAGALIGGYLGATLSQAITRFAPPNQNDTESYIAFVCANTQLTPATVLMSAMLTPPV